MFILVETKENIKKISKMSKSIWKEAYEDILTSEQIDYMLDMFLSKEAIKEQINQGYQYYMIKEDKPCGFAAVKVDEKVFLSKIYLLKDYRQKGILKDFINRMKDYNKPIHLTVNKKNKDAIAVYEHLGFEITDSVITDIGNNYVMDDYVMTYNNDI